MLGITVTVRQLVRELPVATKVFAEFGIDYCCGGQKTLEEACIDAGTTPSQVLDRLEQVRNFADVEPAAIDWEINSLTHLIDHIVGEHHTFTKRAFEEIPKLFNKVSLKHGERHPELLLMQKLFQDLRDELIPHMLKEETVLFPYIVSLESTVQSERVAPRAPFGTVCNPIEVMSKEHENAGRILAELRDLSRDFTPPADSCASYQNLFQLLTEFENDLHQHIHLENNILFPRAISLEESIS